MAEERVSTMRDCVHGLMRIGHLEKLDKRVARRLFSDVSVGTLRKLLQEKYSVKMNASLSQKKAVEMCMMRFYKGSESSRQSAVRMFFETKSTKNYLERSEIEVTEELGAEAMKVVDCDMEDSNLNSNQEDSETTSAENGSFLDTSSETTSSQESQTESMRLIKEFDGLTVLGRAIPVSPSSSAHSSINADFFPFDEIFSFSSKNENGKKSFSVNVEKLLKKTDEKRKTSFLDNFLIRQVAPSFLNLAEPPFFDVTFCLVHFSVPISSTGNVNSNSVTFFVPFFSPEDVLILCFRSIGTKRDNSQSDLPVGLHYTLNDDSSAFAKVPQTFSAKLWAKKVNVFDPPIVLENVKLNAENRLDFSFPKLPENLNYGTHYEGYVFQAKQRSITDLLQTQQRIPITDSLSMLVSLILGRSNETLEPGKTSFQLKCPISFQPLKNPSRGATCRHPRCFEGANYFQLYKGCKDPRWKCVLCGEIVHWYDVRTDELTTFMCKHFPDCDKVDVSLENTRLIFQGVPENSQGEEMDD